MSDVTLYRYAIPSIQYEGWAEVVMGSNGYFSTVSDYGNYAFRWTAFGDGDFREWFLTLGPDYVRCKLDSSKVLDDEATVRNIREAICTARRNVAIRGRRTFTKEQARDAWDEAGGISNYVEVNDWFNRWASYMDDYYDLVSERPPAQIMGFVTHLLPRIKTAIRATLETNQRAQNG